MLQVQAVNRDEEACVIQDAVFLRFQNSNGVTYNPAFPARGWGQDSRVSKAYVMLWFCNPLQDPAWGQRPDFRWGVNILRYF
ncbi:hypothetical protein TNCV_1519511 [Trichonephila clavipes]|nr:hypothetical protein TNCV_1519511 [Trichonephila clavipes]